MDELWEIAAKVIVPIASAAGGAWIRGRSAKKEVNQISKQVEQVAKIADEVLQRFGFKADCLTYRNIVTNLDGDAVMRRELKGVKAAEGSSLAHLPGSFSVTAPHARLVGKPQLAHISSGYPKAVSLVVANETARECDYRLEIAGHLSPSDPPLDCSVEIGSVRSVLMTREAVEAAYTNDSFKSEYVALELELPVAKAVVEVAFPQTYRVEVHPGVFLGRGELWNDKEYQRVKGGFEKLEHGARFTVDGPYVGFKYVLYWTSPTNKAVEELRTVPARIE